MTDYSTVLLSSSGQKPWYIHQCDKWHIKTIAKSHEATGFFCCVYIQNSSKMLRLICHNAYTVTTQTSKTSPAISRNIHSALFAMRRAIARDCSPSSIG